MTPKEEVEELMNEGLAFAKRMLNEYGEFYPFGIIKGSDGDIRHVGAHDGREHPPSSDLITLLRTNYRHEAEAGRYVATALVYDVRIVPPGTAVKTDAVQVELEHRSGYCVDVFFPYTRGHEGQLSFGETFAGQRDQTVFGAIK